MHDAKPWRAAAAVLLLALAARSARAERTSISIVRPAALAPPAAAASEVLDTWLAGSGGTTRGSLLAAEALARTFAAAAGQAAGRPPEVAHPPSEVISAIVFGGPRVVPLRLEVRRALAAARLAMDIPVDLECSLRTRAAERGSPPGPALRGEQIPTFRALLAGATGTADVTHQLMRPEPRDVAELVGDDFSIDQEIALGKSLDEALPGGKWLRAIADRVATQMLSCGTSSLARETQLLFLHAVLQLGDEERAAARGKSVR